MLAWIASSAFALPSIDESLRSGGAAPEDAALVVGIEDYAFLPDVPHARRDLAAVTDLLVYTRGIPAEHVVRLDGASVEQLRGGLERAKAALGPGGRLWVYFAGHGAADPETGALLLMGDDARPDPSVFAARGLAVDALLDDLPAGSLVLLDTCWAGAARSGEALLEGTRFAIPTRLTARPEVTVWTAAAPGQVASAFEPARHGAFTWFVVGALRGWADGETGGARDGVVDLDEASAYVARGLAAAGIASQSPVLEGPRPTALTSGQLEPAPPLSSLTATPAPTVVAGVLGTLSTESFDHPLLAAGYRAPIRHLQGDRYADVADRTLSFSMLYGSLVGDLEGEEVLRRHNRAMVPTAVGATLVGFGALEYALVGWIPLLQISKANRSGLSCDEPDAIDYVCIDVQKSTTAAVVLASTSAALVGSGAALMLSGKKKARWAREELLEAVNERMTR